MNTTNQLKVCLVCGQPKELACFSKCCGYLDGLQASCKECQAKRWKEYKAVHGDEIRKKQREHHSRPEVKARKSRQRTSPEGREKLRAYFAEYRQKNRDKLYEAEKRYDARARANGGRFTAKDWETLKLKYRNRCLACGGDDRLAADHVIPVSLGGTNGIENRQLLCRSCNSRKSDGTTDFRPKAS